MKKGIGILLAISMLANGILLFRVFDLGVTSTYASDETSRKTQQAAAAQKLLSLFVVGTSRTDLIAAAQKSGLEVLDKGAEGLYVDEIFFAMTADKVAAVVLD